VSEEGKWSETKVGTPQGAVISPLLANIYLHYVFDLWIEVWRKKVARGDIIVVRYADDLVVGFEHQAEAEEFLLAFQERLGQFGLELHSEKTRLIEFGRHAANRRKQRGQGKPETFTFLGFVHICKQRRSNGSFIVGRQTASKRLRAALLRVRSALRGRMHEPVRQVGAWLQSVVAGYFRYHAVPGNRGAINAFRHGVFTMWWHTLNRRSQNGRVSAASMARLARQWLPAARTLHPYPGQRFNAIHPR
jgi:RNA-directed DNA polymerase